MDKYVQNMTDRQAEVEHEVESNKADIQALAMELLNNVDKRSEYIFDSMVISYVNDMTLDTSAETAKEIGRVIAMYMDMTFNELNAIPLHDRTDSWRVACSAMITAASEQAKIMSGMTKQSMINGIENARDLETATKNMTADELAEVSVDIKGELNKKKAAKKNG